VLKELEMENGQILEKEIKLLVVDDSAFMRQLIKDLVASNKNISVETASNGKIALQKIRETRPDVMTLDVEMPVLDGLELLDIMRQDNYFIPTIMLSRMTQKNGEITMKALELGAIDFISKPAAGLLAIELDKLGEELLEKIMMSAQVTKNPYPTIKQSPVKMKNTFIIPRVLVIGASTGGPGALYDIFSRLPKLTIPVLVIQHMPSGFTDSLAKRLNDACEMDVKVGEHGEAMKPGTVYVAPGDYHMTVSEDFCINLNQNPSVKGVRPSIDVTLKSIAPVFGGRVLSVILTGMGNDGSEGVKEIKKLGGKCIVQDQNSCVVFGMPEAVIQAHNADSVVSLAKMPEEIIHYLINWN
jgi:two-component system chemotaxis response regulator CheB